jgi:hypothetical protein
MIRRFRSMVVPNSQTFPRQGTASPAATPAPSTITETIITGAAFAPSAPCFGFAAVRYDRRAA